MDPELRSVIRRYSVVAVVLAAAVVWAVVYTNQNATPETAAPPSAREESPPAPALAAPPTAKPPEASREARKAPSLDRLLVEKTGVKRVDCRAACDLEAYCNLRDTDVCLARSCDPSGDVRKVNSSDFMFAKAETCADAAAAPCQEACWKKGECTGHHDDDMRCTHACLALVRQRPDETYVESRCVIESACQDLPLCAGVSR